MTIFNTIIIIIIIIVVIWAIVEFDKLDKNNLK